MANKRLHFGITQVGIAENTKTNYVALHGVQSVGIDTNFNLEQVFELGQLEIYENIEDIPDIQIVIEKVFDGYPSIYFLATSGAPASTLGGRSNQRCMVAISAFDDTKDAASGNALVTCEASGMYVSAYTATLPVQGNCTEQVTLVGNQKRWLTSGQWNGVFTNTDSPAAPQGVQRRENVKMSTSRWPTELPGISSSGTNDGTGTEFSAHIQNVTISTNLGREELFELGRRGPYYRYVTFPVEVTCSIEMTSQRGDEINAFEEGTNLSNQYIFIELDDGLNTSFNLGTKNKLQSITHTGGDTGGGNVSVTYNYVNQNVLTILP